MCRSPASRDEQERLRGYFRLSSKRKQKNQRRSDATGTGGSSREDSIEKDEPSHTAGSVQHGSVAGGGSGGGGVGGGGSSNPENLQKHATKLRHERERSGGSGGGDRYSGAPYRQGKDRDRTRDRERDRDRDRDRDRRGGRGPGDAGVVNNLGKDVRGKKHDVKINIISDGGSGHAHPHRKLGGSASGSASSNRSRQGQGSSPGQGHRSSLKLTAECLSNVTASTYCNGNGSGSGNGNSIAIPDDSSTSNYGDGEESSVVSSMMVPPQRWPPGGGVALLRHKDVSFSECSSSTFSSSTLERDLEIMDQLERERSMDIQEMLQREREREREKGGRGRQLPDIEKLYAQRSPKGGGKAVARGGSGEGGLALVLPGSDPLSSLSQSQSQSLSTEYSLCSTLETGGSVVPLDSEILQKPSQIRHNIEEVDDEEVVPPDFYDSYTPGGSQNLPPAATAAAPPAYQYQYSRSRLSRKSCGSGSGSMSGSGSGHHHGHGYGQHGSGGVGLGVGHSGRNSKRDSFNSLNGTDLIAGAFCELDPTQPLNKMAVIEGRMRRSSPRNASFSSGSGVSGGRSSMKSSSRDYDYGHGSSSHSAHPELDFRENIFAEL